MNQNSLWSCSFDTPWDKPILTRKRCLLSHIQVLYWFFSCAWIVKFCIKYLPFKNYGSRNGLTSAMVIDFQRSNSIIVFQKIHSFCLKSLIQLDCRVRLWIRDLVFKLASKVMDCHITVLVGKLDQLRVMSPSIVCKSLARRKAMYNRSYFNGWSLAQIHQGISKHF